MLYQCKLVDCSLKGKQMSFSVNFIGLKIHAAFNQKIRSEDEWKEKLEEVQQSSALIHTFMTLKCIPTTSFQRL